MTRFIGRDSRTQVNSNLIGVQVKTAPAPDTDSITTTFLMDRAQVISEGDAGRYSCYRFIASQIGGNDDNNIYVVFENTGETITFEDVEYGVCVIRFVNNVNYTYLCNAESFYYVLSEGMGGGVYRLIDNEGEGHMDFQADSGGNVMQYGGDIWNFHNNRLVTWTVLEGGVQATYDQFYDSLGGEYDVFRTIQGVPWVWLGVATSIEQVVLENVDFYWDQADGDLFRWFYQYEYDIVLFVYTMTRNPEIGDYSYQNKFRMSDYSQITGVGREPAEEVNCSVEYSVDGETWTSWGENLTVDNNILADVPRYVYFRFGQDVLITEE